MLIHVLSVEETKISSVSRQPLRRLPIFSRNKSIQIVKCVKSVTCWGRCVRVCFSSLTANGAKEGKRYMYSTEHSTVANEREECPNVLYTTSSRQPQSIGKADRERVLVLCECDFSSSCVVVNFNQSHSCISFTLVHFGTSCSVPHICALPLWSFEIRIESFVNRNFVS